MPAVSSALSLPLLLRIQRTSLVKPSQGTPRFRQVRQTGRFWSHLTWRRRQVRHAPRVCDLRGRVDLEPMIMMAAARREVPSNRKSKEEGKYDREVQQIEARGVWVGIACRVGEWSSSLWYWIILVIY